MLLDYKRQFCDFIASLADVTLGKPVKFHYVLGIRHKSKSM